MLSIISLHCHYIKIDITEKLSLCTGLFTWETRLLFIRSTEPEPSIYMCKFFTGKFLSTTLIHIKALVDHSKVRQWLLPSFLLVTIWLTGMDWPVLFLKTCFFAIQNKKTWFEKCLQISGKPLSIVSCRRFDLLSF